MRRCYCEMIVFSAPVKIGARFSADFRPRRINARAIFSTRWNSTSRLALWAREFVRRLRTRVRAYLLGIYASRADYYVGTHKEVLFVPHVRAVVTAASMTSLRSSMSSMSLGRVCKLRGCARGSVTLSRNTTKRCATAVPLFPNSRIAYIGDTFASRKESRVFTSYLLVRDKTIVAQVFCLNICRWHSKDVTRHSKSVTSDEVSQPGVASVDIATYSTLVELIAAIIMQKIIINQTENTIKFKY